jgi:hypothetical protein
VNEHDIYKKGDQNMINRTFRIISLAVMTAILLASAPAQGQQQRKAASKPDSQAPAAAPAGNTPGRIAKFTTTKAVGDSNITEDAAGNIGIGTTLPTSMLTVNGVIEMLSGGGIKFPDGTIQTTAGLATVSRDDTLKGDGTQASPLGLTVPLTLSSAIAGGVLTVSNTKEFGDGMTVIGGPSGSGQDPLSVALRAQGGVSNSFRIGGTGVFATGGFNGGRGVIAIGGEAAPGRLGGTAIGASGGASQSFIGGRGLDVGGGESNGHNGGEGIVASGGISRAGAGFSGGAAIVAFPGRGFNGAADGLAGKFNGNVQVTGVLSKGGGSFKIDHPLDPENKYLSHSFVESPDMMNIYNGNITTDQNGMATVELPDYFESLNSDFRYQLTVIGQFAQAIVAEKVKENRFTIQTSAPGVEVSWQVTGIRQDAWANKNRIPVEEAKSEKERGFYLHPEAFGKDEERNINWANEPELMREMKQRRQEAEQGRRPLK